MSEPERKEVVIFNAALELELDAGRAAYLDRACAGDGPLRRKVEALLRAHAGAEEFFEATATDGAAAQEEASPDMAAAGTIRPDLPEDEPGGIIGRYKLLEKVGEGGFGAVYVAEQREPVKRRVALKIIKLGMDTRQVVARFEAERQALALMDHPNIAKVLDAGATETGRPYFVMELVRGIPITRYCEQEKLSTQDRLDLFIKVCHAIQHAHQKGIIHRDIKPSNILVTLHDGVPVPKVIDFGIAKATQQELTDKTIYTQLQQFIGTPAYMSPEQAEMSGLDIDTRSDIYSLGVLLYELLTGQTPFDPKELMKAGVEGMRRTIREVEPMRPSTRLTQQQAAGKSQIKNQKSKIENDLDWIVMKCLEKDRTRRYETANGLATDVQRYLINEPVSARPPSKLYRLRKLVRRNRTTFAAISVGMAALIIGLVVALYLYVQEKAATKRAQAAEQQETQMRQRAEQRAAWSQQIARAGLLLMRQKYDESEQIIRNVPPTATLVPFYNTFGSVHARRGEWPESLTNWNLVVEYAPADHIGYMYLAPLLLQLKDVEGYKRCRSEILQHFGKTSDPRIAERMTTASLLLPPIDNEMTAIARMADVALRGETNTDNWGFNLFAKGFAEYRMGHCATAVRFLQRVPPLDTGWRCRTEAYSVLAMAQFRLNQPNESRASLAKAIETMNRQSPKTGELGGEWNVWIADHVLMREAEALIPMTAEPGKSKMNRNDEPLQK